MKLPVLGMLVAAAVLLILPLVATSELVYDDFYDGTLGTNTPTTSRRAGGAATGASSTRMGAAKISAATHTSRCG